jgi:phage I-like protein
MENRDEPMTLSALAGSSVSFDREHLPERLKLFAWGENQTPDGPIVVNDVSVAALNKQIAADTFKRIAIDFEHQSLKGHPNYVVAPRHNAAHGDLEVVPGDGVYVTALSWTPKGVEHGPDYCDLSPVAIHTKRKAPGEPVVLLGILSAALCDNGAVKGLSAFSASYQHPEAIMDDQQKIIEGLQTALAKLTDENKSLKGGIEEQGRQIEAQRLLIEKLETRLNEAPAVTAASVDQVRAIAEAALKPEALAEGKQQLSALSARIDSLQKEHMIQMAVLQGKAVTLDETAISAMSAESLAQHISGLGATLPIVRRTPAGSAAEPATSALSSGIDALIAQIRQETGIQDFQALWELARGRKPELFKK